ncbi:MAG TPA: hypothetical protein VF899_08085 [Pyrinomonadaceae bacterium]
MGKELIARFTPFLMLTNVAIVLSCAPSAAGQTVKATVVSTTLEATTFPQWSQDLGYHRNQLYPLILDALGLPFVEVDISDVKLSLMLDSGTARGFVITNHAPSVPHRVEERTEELNADGSHRGESFRIRVERISVLGKVFRNVAGSLSDWRMFSSEPFNGTVGLDFFLDRRLARSLSSA